MPARCLSLLWPLAVLSPRHAPAPSLRRSLLQVANAERALSEERGVSEAARVEAAALQRELYALQVQIEQPACLRWLLRMSCLKRGC